jgi:hypothetical protein
MGGAVISPPLTLSGGVSASPTKARVFWLLSPKSWAFTSREVGGWCGLAWRGPHCWALP